MWSQQTEYNRAYMWNKYFVTMVTLKFSKFRALPLGTLCSVRSVWRYQRGNQNPYIEEEQTTQWPKEKVQKDKQRYTKHTYKSKDRVTRTPLKTGVNLGAPEG